MILYSGANYMGADFGFEPSGTFGDAVWIDTNGDGVYETNEAGVPYVTVTATDGTTTLTTTTDADGYYYFTNVTVDKTYTVTVDTSDTDWPSGLSITPVYDPDGTLNSTTTVIVNSSGVVTSVGGCTTTPDGCDDANDDDPLHLDADFGYQYATGSRTLSGTVCLENANADGLCDDTADESYYGGVTAYLYKWVDDGNGTLEAGETTLIDNVLTDSNGDYSFSNLQDNTKYAVTIGAPGTNLDLTTDATDLAGYNNVGIFPDPSTGTDVVAVYQTVEVPSDNVTNRDFAFKSNLDYDFGDLPAPYSTTLDGSPDGPRHVVPTDPTDRTLYLGDPAAPSTSIDIDSNGQPTDAATGDDDDGNNDDDGVTITITDTNDNWTDGASYSIEVDVVAPAKANADDAYLVGWIDFNQDGSFNYSEMVINQGVENGQNQIFTGTVAAGVFDSDVTLNSRFRLFASPPLFPSLSFTGAADNGEVEDYQQSWGMTIDKDVDLTTTTVTPDGTVIYKVIVTNTGNQTLNNIQVTDTLPDFTPSDSLADTAANKGYSVTSVAVAITTDSSPSSDSSLTANNGTFDGVTATSLLTGATNILGPQDAATITITLQLSSVEEATYDNTAAADSDELPEIDDNGETANDTDTPDYGETTPTADPEDDEDVTVTLAASIGDFVWLDADADGIQDAGETTGIENVVVNAYADTDGNGIADDTTVVATDTTDSNGAYSLSVPAGKYVLKFDTSGVTGTYNLSAKSEGSDVSKDSDVVVATGYTDTITLAAGATNNNIDLSMYEPATIGDFVWLDAVLMAFRMQASLVWAVSRSHCTKATEPPS